MRAKNEMMIEKGRKTVALMTGANLCIIALFLFAKATECVNNENTIECLNSPLGLDKFPIWLFANVLLMAYLAETGKNNRPGYNLMSQGRSFANNSVSYLKGRFFASPSPDPNLEHENENLYRNFINGGAATFDKVEAFVENYRK